MIHPNWKPILVLAVIVVATIAGTVSSQDQGRIRQALPLDKYDALYAAMFPNACDSFSPATQEYALDVRIRPSFRAPYQISIRKSSRRGAEIIQYRLRNEREPLGEQVMRLLESGMAMEPATLALGLNIDKKEILAPSRQTQSSINAFFTRHSFPKRTGISLDGVGYDICYADGGSTIRTTFDGSEVFEFGEPSMVTWARKLASTLR